MNWRKRKPDWADAPSARSEPERVDELLRAATAINVRMARGG